MPDTTWADEPEGIYYLYGASDSVYGMATYGGSLTPWVDEEENP